MPHGHTYGNFSAQRHSYVNLVQNFLFSTEKLGILSIFHTLNTQFKAFSFKIKPLAGPNEPYFVYYGPVDIFSLNHTYLFSSAFFTPGPYL